MQILKATLPLCVVLALLSPLIAHAATVQGNEPGSPVRKKVIESGWDMPDTAWLRQNLAEMEKQPFDGITLTAVGRMDATNTVALSRAFINQPWDQKWFQPCLDDLRACKFTSFTDNFLMVSANPGDIDWFDDAAWRCVAEHWRIAAWLARQGGLRGLLFDGEAYEGPQQFIYRSGSGAQKHTVKEVCAKARERGREVMQAVAREYPDITILCYFMNSYYANAFGQNDDKRTLPGNGYSLYSSFIDGWLDAAPPGMTFVDGCEDGYKFNSAGEYLEQSLLVKNGGQQLVSPENRAKYRAQVQAGFPIYLNVYANPPSSVYSIDMRGMSPADRLRHNLYSALRVSDEYVWIYNEAYSWWALSGREPMAKAINPQRWPEVLPGCDRALRLARARAGDRDKYARERLNAEILANLARNGDFTSDKAATNQMAAADWKEGGAPAGWTTWEIDQSKGTFTWDRETGCAGKGSARVAGTQNGCFIQTYKVNPGDCYAIRAARRLQGAGEAVITVRWQSPFGKWTPAAQDRHLLTAQPRGEWADFFATVDVPEGAGIMVLILGAERQVSPADVVWYDDVGVYRLD